MASDPTGIALYAALSEQVYRRNEDSDQAIKLTDIRSGLRLTSVDTSLLPASLNLTSDGGYIYSTGGGTNGFVAMVTQIEGKYIVTIRGTDSTLSAWGTTLTAALTGNSPATPTTPTLIQGVMDYGDAYTNRNLGFGTTAVTQ
jgi:hypothetical protein